METCKNKHIDDNETQKYLDALARKTATMIAKMQTELDKAGICHHDHALIIVNFGINTAASIIAYLVDENISDESSLLKTMLNGISERFCNNDKVIH